METIKLPLTATLTLTDQTPEQFTIESLKPKHKQMILSTQAEKYRNMPDQSQLAPATSEELDLWLPGPHINIGVINEPNQLLAYRAFTNPGADATDNLGIGYVDTNELKNVWHTEIAFVADQINGNKLQYGLTLLAMTLAFSQGMKYIMGTTHPENAASKHNIIKSGIPIIESNVTKYGGLTRDIHLVQVTPQLIQSTHDKLEIVLNGWQVAY